MFDGYGLALEQYDLVGRWIEKDGDFTLTGQATISGLDGTTQSFRGAQALGKILAASSTARGCFVEKTFRHASGFTTEQVEPTALARATKAFRASGDMRKVLLDMVGDPSFVSRPF